MKNLEGKELKKSIRDNIIFALSNAKNIDIEITFIFTGIYQNEKFTISEVIRYMLGRFEFKNVAFRTNIIEKDKIIDILVDNFYYDEFSYVSCIKKIGKAECHGHGEYWGSDSFTFVYNRYS